MGILLSSTLVNHSWHTNWEAYSKGLNMIPLVAQTRTLMLYLLPQSIHRYRHTDSHIKSDTNTQTIDRDRHTRETCISPNTLCIFSYFWLVHILSTQINSNSSSKTLLKCHFSFVALNCLLTCIATLQFELKGKNHLIYLYTINPYNKH